jgi:hypothetical protein
MYPLPHHLHHSDEMAARVGRVGKPEAYYFPPQYNFANDTFPYTFFGLEPGTTKDQVVDCLKRWHEGDNHILGLSKAYRLQVGTGLGCRRASCMRPARTAPTSRSAHRMCSRCGSR